MKLLTTSSNLLTVLNHLGINSSEDLLKYLPYRYEDKTYSDELDLLDKEKVTILGKLVSNPVLVNKGKFSLIQFFFISNHNEFYRVKIFNQPYLMKMLTLGELYSVSGTYSLKGKEINLTSLKKGVISSEEALRPLYHLLEGISQSVYRNLVKRTLEKCEGLINDPMIDEFKKKYHLLDYYQALKMIHFPKNKEEIHLALRTLKYHECLAFSLKNQICRGENKRLPLQKKTKIELKKVNDFILSLPFKLTKDQISAIREIVLDMNKDELMYRLLQGDVGSGKTLVAMASLYANYLRHNQGAFMVPTDSLARQQFEDIKKYFSPFNIKVDLLIGSLSLKEKKEVKEKLINHQTDIVVGTHALFSEDVYYDNLGLAIIDEQHKFGVNQRNLLVSKGDNCDLLLMSATPIPRTLAISIYGDLDVSTLASFPHEERKVITEIVRPDSPEINLLIHEMLEANRQIFIVAPKISGDDEEKSVIAIYEKYSLLFPNQVLLLHGKMDSEEKEKILKDFIDKKKLILVATTVIELGINVLSAGLMIIYNASSFGLASLHQLRGRVSRDGQSGYCLLVSENEDPRLSVLVDSNDGFHIAEEDMKMRGPGDMIGVRQSGFPSFATLNIVDDFRMFECARDDAKKIVDNLANPSYQKYYALIKQELATSAVNDG